jgi:hypothetical protein
MCFLKVCPFAKPIGQDCQIEKRPDQCCPIITCPERNGPFAKIFFSFKAKEKEDSQSSFF